MIKHILFLCTVVYIIPLSSCGDFQKSNGEEIKIEKGNQEKILNDFSSVELPEVLDFCGEKLPLDVPEIRERAERELLLNLQQPGQIMLYLKRSERYFPLFERILKEEGMPDDLKYLPVAESALYMSRSGKDAVGLWQFMPETARTFGLTVDEFVDERRHPQKSTEAALRYLKGGYKRFRSWLMAAAGYNMGYTGLEDDCNFQGTEKFSELFLNEETSRYIFRIAVIKHLMKNGHVYGLHGVSNGYKPQSEKTIEVSEAISNLSEWAREHGTTYKSIKLLNPWILKRTLPKPKHSAYKIAIPVNE